jgi:hypothetical protein
MVALTAIRIGSGQCYIVSNHRENISKTPKTFISEECVIYKLLHVAF